MTIDISDIETEYSRLLDDNIEMLMQLNKKENAALRKLYSASCDQARTLESVLTLARLKFKYRTVKANREELELYKYEPRKRTDFKEFEDETGFPRCSFIKEDGEKCKTITKNKFCFHHR
jgi:hypothetical protein